MKKETQANAPVRSKRYQKSWAVKKQKESSNALEVVVHSRDRYQLTHLLEKGHTKRGGGRVRAIPHIAPAEEKGIRELEEGMCCITVLPAVRRLRARPMRRAVRCRRRR